MINLHFFYISATELEGLVLLVKNLWHNGFPSDDKFGVMYRSFGEMDVSLPGMLDSL